MKHDFHIDWFDAFMLACMAAGIVLFVCYAIGILSASEI